MTAGSDRIVAAGERDVLEDDVVRDCGHLPRHQHRRQEQSEQPPPAGEPTLRECVGHQRVEEELEDVVTTATSVLLMNQVPICPPPPKNDL